MMAASRLRAFPEWPVHLLIWLLLLVKDVLATYDAPPPLEPGAAAATYWLLPLRATC